MSETVEKTRGRHKGMAFGEQLRRRREELGLTRGQLAQTLGVSKSAVGNYETGVSTPKEDIAFV